MFLAGNGDRISEPATVIKQLINTIHSSTKMTSFQASNKSNDIYTYNDKDMRCFVRQSIKRRRVCAFNQYYKSITCNDILNFLSEELNIEGNVFDIIDANLNYKNKQFKFYKKDYENQFNDYRHQNAEEKEKNINEKTSKLPIHQLIKQIN